MLLALLSVGLATPLQASPAAQTDPLQQLTTAPGTDVRPTWSPDQTSIAFQSDRSGVYSIWIMDADGGNQRQVTVNEASDRHPAWSPDGTQLVYDSDASGSREIWVIDRDGQNPQQLTTLGLNSTFPAWSPGGNQIVFYVYAEGKLSLWTIGVDGTNPYPLTVGIADERNNQCTFACHQVGWSPDGQKIAYTGGDQRSVWLINADGSDPREIVTSDGYNLFSWYTPEGEVGYLTEHLTSVDAWTDAWTLDPVTGETTLLMEHIRHQGPLEWNQDHTTVLFHSSRSGNFEIYIADLLATAGRDALQAMPGGAEIYEETTANPADNGEARPTAPEAGGDEDETMAGATPAAEERVVTDTLSNTLSADVAAEPKVVAEDTPAVVARADSSTQSERQAAVPENQANTKDGMAQASTTFAAVGLLGLIILGVTVYMRRGGRRG